MIKYYGFLMVLDFSFMKNYRLNDLNENVVLNVFENRFIIWKIYKYVYIISKFCFICFI